ncbi:hypothetical protein [Actinomadura rupiterrae]|uniref:hypothetical protein n=1 Tax=Actinomadura rupiterrae TaxID=559627 RepID=UPI0020A43C85|nr:hypothetical protein [Actinomadura rupiterrae]MCP2342148.1 hypothetical protein [Actinomadura rupiterrae]
MPTAISEKELLDDLNGWYQAEAPLIDKACNLKGGGWEQWAIVQFLFWQTAHRGAQAPSYQREYIAPPFPERAFDIAYNMPKDVLVDSHHPLILTQWKALRDGNAASMGAQTDIGTLQEVRRVLGKTVQIYPMLVILSPQEVGFPGRGVVGPLSAGGVRLYVSSSGTFPG